MQLKTGLLKLGRGVGITTIIIVKIFLMSEEITQQKHRIQFENKAITNQKETILKQTEEIVEFMAAHKKTKLDT